MLANWIQQQMKKIGHNDQFLEYKDGSIYKNWSV
jgi:hypothetical protein